MDGVLRWFTRSAKLMRGAADLSLRRHGVRVGQNLVLEALWERDGLTPGAMAERLHVTTPTVVKMANRMEAAGLLTRRRDAADSRLVRLHLTERGKAVQLAVERELAMLEERATTGLGEDERRCLLAALERIVHNLEGEVPPEEAPDQPI
jgi:MarR family transcriptional regulator, organic hydroperoxide resistance regulator